MQSITIAGRRIGPDAPPYIIAEVSANHGGDLARAKRIIDIAADKGADAVKFQAYTADSLTLDSERKDFLIQGDNPWRGWRLHALYQDAATPYAWFPELFAHAKTRGIPAFASVFCKESLALLESFDAPAYKIASFEAVDTDLIAACSATGKPVIISTGLCTLADIQIAYDAAKRGGGKEIALLRCNSAYPADPAEANLATIADMIRQFDVPIGYSDHTVETLPAAIAVGIGACIVEKHVIDTREPATADSSFSCLPDQLEALVKACREAYLARGGIKYGPSKREEPSIVFRRSLYAVADIAAGEKLTQANVRSIRPGHGLPPRHFSEIMGKPVRRAIARGEPISWDALG
ncbi:MAG TPA: pseudaminic acid synthase [Stellaceae bacterium]|nr:pseudaminic acid synthase [Stellaceae bacterium]